MTQTINQIYMNTSLGEGPRRLIRTILSFVYKKARHQPAHLPVEPARQPLNRKRLYTHLGTWPSDLPSPRTLKLPFPRRYMYMKHDGGTVYPRAFILSFALSQPVDSPSDKCHVSVWSSSGGREPDASHARCLAWHGMAWQNVA